MTMRMSTWTAAAAAAAGEDHDENEDDDDRGRRVALMCPMSFDARRIAVYTDTASTGT